MNQVEEVKRICKERKISIHKLEVDCGFANGYISQLKKGVFPSDRLQKIADYLDLPINHFVQIIKVASVEEPEIISIKIPDQPALNQREQRLLNYFHMLSGDMQDRILDLIEATAKDAPKRH